MTKENENIRERFRRSDALIVKKLFEYIPVMIITNLCSLLLISVDGLVVGNLVGENALASVSIFRPITVLIGVASVLVATGIGTTLSLCMGENDHKRLAVVKATSKLIMIISAILVLVLGFPAVLLFISSYGLSPEMTELTREYAIGVMISMPFGLISTVGVYQLQIVGEMKTIMRLLDKYLHEAIEVMTREGMRIRVLGDVSGLSPELQALVHSTDEVADRGHGCQANLCINYGGRDEIVRAARRYAEDLAAGRSGELDEEGFSRYLYTAGMPDPDLLIRPGGEQRLSNFLLWQCAYAEFYFTDVLWPDFTPAELDKAIAVYQKRERRYGGVKQG